MLGEKFILFLEALINAKDQRQLFRRRPAHHQHLAACAGEAREPEVVFGSK
jgi:hypothetical protein